MRTSPADIDLPAIKKHGRGAKGKHTVKYNYRANPRPYAGFDEGAKRAALALTVLGTAVNHGLDPVAYLTDVFKQIAGGLPKIRFVALHPAVWAEKRTQQVTAYQPVVPRLAG